MSFLETPTPNLFFTGKGGVGKTSSSCATALHLAEQGRRVLLVSTDPASNLEEVLAANIGQVPTPIPDTSGLFALNIDPEQAAAAYRDKVIGPYRSILPAAAVAAMEEQLAGACTVEIAAFNEFAALLANADVTDGFDHIIFDTAPTGHTLRLLSLPSAWSGFIENSAAGTSCLGPLQGLVNQREMYAAAVRALADAQKTTLVLVSRPEQSALQEAERTSAELAALGIRNQHLLINGLFKAALDSDLIALALERRGRQALQGMPAELAQLARTDVPLKPREQLGMASLRTFFKATPPLVAVAAHQPVPHVGPIDNLIDALAAQGSGLIMTMGKGGVGKTTTAVAIAQALVARGHKALLTTTDPAGHAGATPASAYLKVDRIDPKKEVERYRNEVMATTGAKLDAGGKALLAEDLASPCTEEIAVFQAFATTVAAAQDRFVVLDTAPTGHTILLLDAAKSFHNEVSRQAKAVPEHVLRLLERLRDPTYTRVIICTLPEATPVHEAAALQKDLRRASIEPFAWIITQSFAPHGLSDPLLLARQAQESKYIREVTTELAQRVALVPWSNSDDVTVPPAHA
ncbi:MAG: arsenical pump-driving ATPase [Hyphomonadaceae bacterium]|nr:arsenical pump-driving ATPase [Hyphomonadaceae bacterium]